MRRIAAYEGTVVAQDRVRPPGDLIAWAVRTHRISAARSLEYLQAAANGDDVSVLLSLTPAPADVVAGWADGLPLPVEPDEFASLFPPSGDADSAGSGRGGDRSPRVASSGGGSVPGGLPGDRDELPPGVAGTTDDPDEDAAYRVLYGAG
jgi:hypothetical protein